MKDFFDNLQTLKSVRAADPEGYKTMIKEQRRKERILPRSLRRAYKSKNEAHITKEIGRAILKGFTKEEIKADFLKWKEDRQFIE